MAKTRLAIAKRDIVTAFETLPMRVMTQAQIKGILRENREFWRLAQSTTARQFIAFLTARTDLKRVVLQFPSRREVRYTWGDVPLYELALSLRPGCYLTHFTAMHLHDLTDQLPNKIYVNFEQTRKPSTRSHLQQDRIRWAFSRPPRVSRNVASYGSRQICLLNGMHTGHLGVVEIDGAEGETLRLTGIERTLIDIAVRPFYAGGVYEVLRAYRMAKSQVSVNKLAAMLTRLNYTYPYHQAIGFYLDRSGAYRRSLLQLLRKFDIVHDFYLTHQMKKTSYSKEWRLFFPEGL